MITLALETSTSRGSVAVHDGQVLLFAESFQAERGHSALLFPLLQRARAVAAPQQIAVGLGPGSYAGVRIAIASAMGLELAWTVPLVGLPSAAVLAEAGRYVAIGDARRGLFYWTSVAEGVCEDGPRLVSGEELRALLGAADCEILSTELLPAFPETRLAFPQAGVLARLAAQGRGIVARGMLEPIYLREPHITQPKPRS